MNVALVADYENGAVAVDSLSGTMVDGQRARELLGSITAKREELEQQHQHKVAGGTMVQGRPKEVEGIVLSKKTTTRATTARQQDFSSTLATKFHQALRDKRDRLRKHLRVDDDQQDNTQTTDTSTTTPLVSPGSGGFRPIEIAAASEAPRLISIGKSPQRAAKVRSSMSWDEGPHSPITVSKSLRKTQSFDDTDQSLSRYLTETRTRTIDEHVKSVARLIHDTVGSHQPLIERPPRRSGRSRSLESSGRARTTPLIKLSLSLDGVRSKSLVAPRGDRSQHLMTLGDIEVPLEISTLDTRCSTKPLRMTACISRRTGSKISVESTEKSCDGGCTLQTTKARAEYIDKLYHAPAKNKMRTVRTSPSIRRRARAKLDHDMIRTHQEETMKADASTTVIAVVHNYNTTASNGEDLMKLSLTDSCDRREMLRRLQLDLNRPKPTKKLSEAVRKAASFDTNEDSSTEDCIPFSDDSLCDFTTSSETISIGSIGSALQTNQGKAKVRFAEQPPSIFRMSNKLPNPTRKLSPVPFRDILGPAGPVKASSKASQSGRPDKVGPLVIDPDESDQCCQASGGLFDLATKSGLDQIGEVPLQRLVVGTACVRPQVHLSTDFRCGTYGSLYDIALRSGCFQETTKPRLPPKTKVPGKTKCRPTAASGTTNIADPRNPPARGSLYDIALRSGLTKEMIRTRSSFSFTVKHSSRGTKPCVVLPEESDQRCGAGGSLYLASTCLDKKRSKKTMPQHRFGS